MVKAVVTGAAGFIGGQLVQRLLNAGQNVRAVARNAAAVAALQSLGAEPIAGDVTQPETLPAVVRDADVVYHLAGLTRAKSLRQFLSVNELGTANLLAACAAASSPPTVVLVSSLAAAGPAFNGQPRTEEQPPRPVSHYGRSKLAGEQAACALAHRMPVSVVRPPIVLGGNDRTGLAMFRMINRIRLHLTPGRRHSRFSVVHVDDLVTGLLLVAEKGERLTGAQSEPGGRANGQAPDSDAVDPTGVYYITGPEQPTYPELGRMVGAALGRRVRVLRFPAAIVWPVAAVAEATARLRGRAAYVGIDKAREALAGDWICSSAKAERQLGFHPAAPLEVRLRQTADWYRAAGWL